MERLRWAQVPERVRGALEERFGRIHAVESAPPGLTLNLAARLETAGGSLFVKAVDLADAASRHCVRERSVGLAMPGGDTPVPALLWTCEADGWMALAFEYLAGRAADLSPESADLPHAADALARLDARLTPSPWPDAPSVLDAFAVFRGKARLLLDGPDGESETISRCASTLAAFDESILAGGGLIHGDLHAGNLLATARGVFVTDWSLACRGAPWVDLARLAPRLVGAGHSPASAERVLGGIPAWKAAPEHGITAVAAALTLFREYEARHGPPRLRAQRARMAEAGHAWLSARL